MQNMWTLHFSLDPLQTTIVILRGTLISTAKNESVLYLWFIVIHWSVTELSFEKNEVTPNQLSNCQSTLEVKLCKEYNSQ